MNKMGTTVSLQEISKISEELRKQGKKIVTTNGVFDLLHTGHVKLLKDSKNLGHILIVCLNSDSSVKLNKGDKRPLNRQEDRAELLSSLNCVDYVVIFNEIEPSAVLQKIKPHIHTKATDYSINKVVEKKVVEANGGKVKLLPLVPDKSTTQLIKKIVETYGNSTEFKECAGNSS